MFTRLRLVGGGQQVIHSKTLSGKKSDSNLFRELTALKKILCEASYYNVSQKACLQVIWDWFVTCYRKTQIQNKIILRMVINEVILVCGILTLSKGQGVHMNQRTMIKKSQY